MYHKRVLFLINIIFLLGVFSSCKKQIALDPPVTLLVTPSVFNSDNTATAAQLSIYAQILSYPWTLHRVTALSSDEFNNFATDQTSKDLYSNALDATIDAPQINLWSPSYSYIYQVNAIIEGLSQSKGVSDRIKKQINGEAAFMRSFLYFYLVNLYGDVPLITSTDYKVNAVLPRAPKEQVYRQIIEDLTTASSNLSSSYVDATDTAITTDRIRPTSWAAEALLSRAYLYTHKYDSAETQASNVISNTDQFGLLTDLNKVFLKNSREAIWQIPPASGTYSTAEGIRFSLKAIPSSATTNSTSISTQLLNAFEPDDQRKVKWINSYSNGSNTWNYPYKYKDNGSTTALNEYTMMLRLAELFLIRAEARIQQDNVSGGIADLNVIRKRAGLIEYSGPTDKTSLLNAISHERQVELFTEGDRWIDLKRIGAIDALMGDPGGICVAKGGRWNTNSQVYPLPLSDIQNNTNLIQNKDY